MADWYRKGLYQLLAEQFSYLQKSPPGSVEAAGHNQISGRGASNQKQGAGIFPLVLEYELCRQAGTNGGAGYYRLGCPKPGASPK